MGARLGGEVLGLERARAGQQLVGDHGERVAIRRGGRGLAHRLLGREVGGGAEDLARRGELVLPREAGDAEVGDGEALAAVEQEVAGLDVAVHDAGVVRGVEGRRGLVEPPQRLLMRNFLMTLKTVSERAAAHDLHDHEDAARVLADVVDRDHVRVRGKAGRGTRFPLETPPGALILAQMGSQQLDRDIAV